MSEKLKPPEGCVSWLHYAISTMDTRSLDVYQNFDNTYWGRNVSQDEMTEAAMRELNELCGVTDVNDICTCGSEKLPRLWKRYLSLNR